MYFPSSTTAATQYSRGNSEHDAQNDYSILVSYANFSGLMVFNFFAHWCCKYLERAVELLTWCVAPSLVSASFTRHGRVELC